MSDEENEMIQIQEDNEKLKSVPPEVWHLIEEWGKATDELTEQKRTVAFNLAGRVRNNTKITDYERQTGITILDLIIEKAPRLLDQIDDLNEKRNESTDNSDITIELIKKIVLWDKKNKRLKDFEYRFMAALAGGKKALTERNKFIARNNLSKVKKHGFSE